MRTAIVVRTKDRPSFLARALDDVLAQTSDDWELVVVNDGGDPAAVDAAVATRTQALAGRATVLHNPRSLGMEAASNQGIAATSAPYVAVHDDDDTWAPGFLEATASALDADHQLVAVTAATEIVVEEVVGDGFREIERRAYVPPHDVVTLYDMLIMNRVVPIALVMRRSALDAVGPFDETLPVVGDWDMNLRLAAHGDIAYLADEVRAFWHQRPQAVGAEANSLFAGEELHARFDRVVRERALRAYAQQHGIGGLMYLARHVQDVGGANAEAVQTAMHEALGRMQQDVIDHVDRRFDELLGALAAQRRHSSLRGRLTGAVRRILPRR